jgi:hypothetical protein
LKVENGNGGGGRHERAKTGKRKLGRRGAERIKAEG